MARKTVSEKQIFDAVQEGTDGAAVKQHVDGMASRLLHSTVGSPSMKAWMKKNR